MERKLKHLEIPSSEITPESLYLNRRDFLKAAGIVSATAFLAACGVATTGTSSTPGSPTAVPGWGNVVPTPSVPVPDNAQGLNMDELGNPLNKLDEITNYNNYYEFSTSKDGVAPAFQGFQNLALVSGGERAGAKPEDLRNRRPAQIRTERAHLPAALRGSVEHGHPLDGVRTERHY